MSREVALYWDELVAEEERRPEAKRRVCLAAHVEFPEVCELMEGTEAWVLRRDTVGEQT